MPNFKGHLEESKILFIYRYLSLLITSIFYFLTNDLHPISKKLFIIGCLTISATILSYLYTINEKANKNIKILLLVEIVGNSILLIPSGGIKSPFIWYTLNIILISSVFLKKRDCWIIIWLQVLTAILIGYFKSDSPFNLLGLLKDESNLILSYIMIIIAIRIWSMFVKKTKEKSMEIEEMNRQLKQANGMIIESMDHISALYQSINILNNQGNKDGSIRLLFQYIKNITGTNLVFYYDVSDNLDKVIIDQNNYLPKELDEHIRETFKDIPRSKNPIEVNLSNAKYLLIALKSNFSNYGVLGIESTNFKNSIIYKNNIHQIQFLAQLISVAFDRFYFEEVNERLLISEEQNRIANEIHDSVLQRLFSMSCGIFSLIKKLNKYSLEEMERELNYIRETTDKVMKDLRAKIYGLSWKKFGNNSFITDIKTYIEDIRKLNEVNIPFYIIGNDELLISKQKNALYRIICEGIGNAVRHGRAKNIEVSLTINGQISLLKITDDGIGFDVNKLDQGKGLGIQNLKQLTQSLDGSILIDSKIGKGTTIEVTIPNNGNLMKGEKIVI